MRNITFVSIFMIAVVMVSCTNNTEDKMAENIAAYFAKDIVATPISEGRSVYVDNSDGLYHAYSGNNDNAKILESITQKLTGNNVEWFGLSNDTIEKLDFPSTDLYKKVMDKKWYKH